VGDEGILSSSNLGSHKDTRWWGDYVVVSLLERAADEVLKMQQEKVGGAGKKLYTLEGFRNAFGSVLDTKAALIEGDAKILLKFLERDRKALVFDSEVRYFPSFPAYNHCEQVIKFLVGEISIPHEISPVDRGILELKNAVENLQTQVEGLQYKIDQFSPSPCSSFASEMTPSFRCTQKASAALRQKHRALALSHLRSRTQLEELLTKRLRSLHTLESTYIRVEAAADDIEVRLSVYA